MSVAIAQLEGRLDTTLFERTRAGILHGEVNHELMVDNILDLSHIKVLHPALGSDAVSRAKVKVETTDGRIVTTRHIKGEQLSEGLARSYCTGGATVDRELRVAWQAPSLLEHR